MISGYSPSAHLHVGLVLKVGVNSWGLPFNKRSMPSPEHAAFSNALLMIVGEGNTPPHMELVKHESHQIFQCLVTCVAYIPRPVGNLPDKQLENLDFTPGFAINLLHVPTNFSGFISLYIYTFLIFIICVYYIFVCMHTHVLMLLIFNPGNLLVHKPNFCFYIL